MKVTKFLVFILITIVGCDFGKPIDFVGESRKLVEKSGSKFKKIYELCDKAFEKECNMYYITCSSTTDAFSINELNVEGQDVKNVLRSSALLTAEEKSIIRNTLVAEDLRAMYFFRGVGCFYRMKIRDYTNSSPYLFYAVNKKSFLKSYNPANNYTLDRINSLDYGKSWVCFFDNSWATFKGSVLKVLMKKCD